MTDSTFKTKKIFSLWIIMISESRKGKKSLSHCETKFRKFGKKLQVAPDGFMKIKNSKSPHNRKFIAPFPESYNSVEQRGVGKYIARAREKNWEQNPFQT